MKYKIVEKTNGYHTWYLLIRYYFFNLIPFPHYYNTHPGDYELLLFDSIDEAKQEIIRIEKEKRTKKVKTKIIDVNKSEIEKLIALNSFEQKK
jgi:hypothetical protein